MSNFCSYSCSMSFRFCSWKSQRRFIWLNCEQLFQRGSFFWICFIAKSMSFFKAIFNTKAWRGFFSIILQIKCKQPWIFSFWWTVFMNNQFLKNQILIYMFTINSCSRFQATSKILFTKFQNYSSSNCCLSLFYLTLSPKFFTFDIS